MGWLKKIKKNLTIKNVVKLATPTETVKIIGKSLGIKNPVTKLIGVTAIAGAGYLASGAIKSGGGLSSVLKGVGSSVSSGSELAGELLSTVETPPRGVAQVTGGAAIGAAAGASSCGASTLDNGLLFFCLAVITGACLGFYRELKNAIDQKHG